MINVAKSVIALAKMTEDLQALVAMAEKVNGLEQYEAEAMARIKAMQDEAEKWNVEAYKAKLETEKLSKQAAELITVAKDEAATLTDEACVHANIMKSQAEDALHEAKNQALSLIKEAKDKAAKIEAEAQEVIAKRDAAADTLAQIQDAIKKITG